MASSVVKKVAVALALHNGHIRAAEQFDLLVDPFRERMFAQARAAIEAMRDPTEGMRIVGHAALDASDASEIDVGSRVGFAALGDAWRAMVDEALGVNGPSPGHGE